MSEPIMIQIDLAQLIARVTEKKSLDLTEVIAPEVVAKISGRVAGYLPYMTKLGLIRPTRTNVLTLAVLSAFVEESMKLVAQKQEEHADTPGEISPEELDALKKMFGDTVGEVKEPEVDAEGSEDTPKT